MIKRLMAFACFFGVLLISSLSSSQNYFVLLTGTDDGKKSNPQQDRREAEMDAKLQAMERAGIQIKSITKIENFQMKYRMVETRAGGVLLAGFKIEDMGYQRDGTYKVVLSGFIRPTAPPGDLLFSGLVAYYSFDGDTRDSSGNGLHATKRGASFDTDRRGGDSCALSFDGSNDYVECSHHNLFDSMAREHTITAWIYYKGPNTMREIHQRIVGKVRPRYFESITLGIVLEGNLMTNFATGNERNHLLTSNQIIPTNRWTFVAMTYDASNVVFYIDGNEDSRYQRTGSVRMNQKYLAIGRHGGGTDESMAPRCFNGAIDEVRLYNRALSPSEIQRLYSQG